MQDLAKAHFKVYRHPDQTEIWFIAISWSCGGRNVGQLIKTDYC